MKDRLEFRFTVATGKVEGKAAKQIAKIAEPYLKRIAEALVKVVEAEAAEEDKNALH